MSETAPPTQADGALAPPGRLPPTAIGTAMLPAPESPGPRALRVIRRWLDDALDVADTIADAITGRGNSP